MSDADFEALLEFIKDHRGFDFTGYKRSSLRRRVERRTTEVGVESFSDYLDLLQVDQDEFTALFNTILINVTAFFRDQDAWHELQNEVIPRLLAPKPRGEPVRFWSAGCASGQEAYGLAMLLAEAMGISEFRERVKIYATDVDDEALAVARAASYTDDELQPVPADWRDRYFERSGSRYVFRSDLRRNVIFGRNDLLHDAPIGRLDLLVCRNTLMYLNAETQAQVLARFHFALAGSGVLFLGKAETLLSHDRLFRPVDAKRRFFAKEGQRDPAGPTARQPVNGSRDAQAALGNGLAPLAGETLRFSPLATVVVSGDEVVSAANRRAEAQLGISARDVGRPFTDLELSHRIVGLRSAVEEVRSTGTSAPLHDVEWVRSATETVYFDIHLVPLDADGDARAPVAIFFSDVTRYRSLAGELEQAHRQIETAYEELQSTVEELETTNEELHSTVEELETTNEELQSTNEELETMNEELHSTNHELQSINGELRERSVQLDAANDFLHSIMGSLRVAVIVVGTDLLVRAWNAQAGELWGLRSEEVVGQHLLNLDIGLSVQTLRPLVRDVLAGHGPNGGPLSVDATNRRGRRIGLSITAAPLLGRQERPDGAIIVMDEIPPPGPPTGTE